MFREQLHKIQIDTTLVMRVDPYVDRPLDNFEQDQQRLHQLNGDADGQPGPQTLLDRAGPRFSQWMENIQDLVEERDYALTKYKVCDTFWLSFFHLPALWISGLVGSLIGMPTT